VTLWCVQPLARSPRSFLLDLHSCCHFPLAPYLRQQPQCGRQAHPRTAVCSILKSSRSCHQRTDGCTGLNNAVDPVLWWISFVTQLYLLLMWSHPPMQLQGCLGQSAHAAMACVCLCACAVQQLTCMVFSLDSTHYCEALHC
jgi:hypothetical protein